MLYYRVKPQFDNYTRYGYIGNTNRLKEMGILIGNELYTQAERRKIANASKYFEEVRISQRNTYWHFGARFERKEVKQWQREDAHSAEMEHRTVQDAHFLVV